MKKVFALILSIILIIGIVSGCEGKKDDTNENPTNAVDQSDKTVFDVLSEALSISGGVVSVELELKSNEASAELQTYLGTDTLSVKLDAYSGSDTEAIVNLSLKTSEGYSEALEVIVKDQIIYVNAAKLCDTVETLMPGQGAAQIKTVLGSEYISFTEADLQSLLSSFSDSGLDLSDIASDESTGVASIFGMLGLESVTEADAKDYLTIFTDVLGSKALTMLKDVEPSVLTQNGDEYSLTINNSNIQAVVTAFVDLAESDGVATYNEILAQLKAKKGETDQVYQMLAGVENEVKTAIDEIVSDASKEVNVDDAEFDISLSSSVTGAAGKRIGSVAFNISGSDLEDTIKLAIKYTISEGETKDITVPENATPFADLQSLFGDAFTDGTSDSGL